VRHLRSDYDPIQDPTGHIPVEEPVFLLRAQDMFAPVCVETWASMVAAAGGDPEMCRRVLAWADDMRRWQLDHGSKVPDVPAEVLR
jgi:hypothetical protein